METAVKEETLLAMDRTGPWNEHAEEVMQEREKSASEPSDVAVVAEVAALWRGRDTHDNRETLLQQEIERVRTEMRGAPTGVLLGRLPPTGFVYDGVPDAGDDAVYDALEKSYNAAFASCSSERLARTEDETTIGSSDDADSKAQGVFADTVDSIEERKSKALGKVGLAVAQQDQQWWKDEREAQRLRLLQRMRESVHGSTDVVNDSKRTGDDGDSNGKLDSTWDRLLFRSHPSVLEHSESFSSRRARRDRVLLSLAEACRDRVISRPRMRVKDTTTQPERVMLRIVRSPEGEASSLQQPNVQTSASHASGESKTMNDYLVVELRVFVNCLLQHESVVSEEAIDQIAGAMSLQLYREHRRALIDLEDEWNHIVDRARINAGPSCLLEDNSPVPDSVSKGENPFQLHAEHDDRDVWKSALDHVRGSSSVHLKSIISGNRAVSDTTHAIKTLRNSGVNGVVIHPDMLAEAQSVVATLFSESEQFTSVYLPFVVICRAQDLPEWQHQLRLTPQLQVLLCSGDKDLRRRTIRLLFDHCYSISNARQVLLVSFETIADDALELARGLWQTCIVDMAPCIWSHERFETSWLSALSIRCRQRLLICTDKSSIDARLLVQFLFPSVLSSRRRVMAWNCAGFSEKAVQELCTTIGSCCVPVNSSVDVDAFVAALQVKTNANSVKELRVLDTLDKEGALRAWVQPKENHLIEERRRPFKRLDGWKNQPAKKIRRGIMLGFTSPVDTSYRRPKPLQLSERHHGSDSTPTTRSRKRISRCGKCAGCLAQDCMVCGHCKDMKKYGGPGLRKQSCKNRKCLNPRTWGVVGRSSALELAHDRHELGGDGYTENGDGLGSASSGESADELNGDAHRSFSDSDAADSGPSEELVDSERDEVVDSELLEFSPVGHRSRGNRTRVMRCGKCSGCTAPDCMKCRHCLDMKKYGGPGLRKQSCKNRKCIAPKVVRLNQAKDDERYTDDMDAIGDYSDSEHVATILPAIERHSSAPHIETAQEDPETLGDPRAEIFLPVQECDLLVRRYQGYPCTECSNAFSSSELLEMHHLTEHIGEAQQQWEHTALRFLQHPAHQLALLLATRCFEGSVRGYAKLQGNSFDYYMLKPWVVLGRLNSRWTDFYQSCGVDDPKGLAGGSVDCHLGHDSMIARQHALIQWSPAQECFTIECLSLRSPILVNGREVHRASHPHRLRSRDVIQIGASLTYFLLPTTSSTSTNNLCASEVREWVEASVKKRHAHQFMANAKRQRVQELLVMQRIQS